MFISRKIRYEKKGDYGLNKRKMAQIREKGDKKVITLEKRENIKKIVLIRTN